MNILSEDWISDCRQLEFLTIDLYVVLRETEKKNKQRQKEKAVKLAQLQGVTTPKNVPGGLPGGFPSK
jgi:hypothetical protein